MSQIETLDHADARIASNALQLINREATLDDALDESYPASDPIAVSIQAVHYYQ